MNSGLNNNSPSVSEMNKLIITSCSFILFLFSAHAQDFPVFAGKNYIKGTDTLLYRILLPENYNAKKEYPLIIFLHGYGERGNDNQKQLLHVASFFLKDSIRKKLPAIVIFPQCPETDTWSYFKYKLDTVTHQGDINFTYQENPTNTARLVKLLTDSLINALVADPVRIYIGGLSLGGFGTYDFIERYPGYFAAAFPICGGGDTSFASSIAKNTAVWIFHGSADPVVSVKYSRQYYAVLKQYRADVKYSEYEGVGHNSWDNAVLEPGLVEWILEKQKPKTKTKN
jgi:predicted peptidase